MATRLNLNKFQKRVESQIKRALNRNNLKQLGTLALKLIQDRSRKGYGVENGRLVRFPALSEKYIQQRQRSRLSPFTTARKSNITFTFRLLAGLRVNTKDQLISVSPTGTSRRGVSNKDIAGFLAEKDRVFLDLTKEEITRLARDLKKKLQQSAST
jgi:hypothetical protein